MNNTEKPVVGVDVAISPALSMTLTSNAKNPSDKTKVVLLHVGSEILVPFNEYQQDETDAVPGTTV